jgi:hypothetical protein
MCKCDCKPTKVVLQTGPVVSPEVAEVILAALRKKVAQQGVKWLL